MTNDPEWLKAAYSDLGLKEGAGSANNPRVVEMFAEAGHPEIRQDSVAWCAAAVGAWLARANLKGTGSLTARSYLNYGTKLSTTNIPRGAILVFRRGSSSWQGHVCLCVADEGSRLKVIGGNQSDAVTVTYFSKAALIGARWPETATNSRTLQSGGLSFASLGGAEVMDSLAQTQSLAQEFAPYLRVAQYALVALALIAAGYAAYRFIRKRIRPPEPTEIEGGPPIDQDAPKRKRKTK